MKDKVVMVIGGSTGIGRATALAFARRGARVVVADKGAESRDETVPAINASGGEATYIQTGVSRFGEAKGLIDRVVETHGRLDLLFDEALLLAYSPKDWANRSELMAETVVTQCSAAIMRLADYS